MTALALEAPLAGPEDQAVRRDLGQANLIIDAADLGAFMQRFLVGAQRCGVNPCYSAK